MSTLSSGRASVPTQPTAADAATPAVIDLDAPRPAAAPPASTRTDRVRDAIHVGACMLAGVLVTVGFLLDPAADADSASDIVAAAADDAGLFYWSNTMSAFGLAMMAGVGLAVMRLVRGRGRVLATIGGLLTAIGGVAAAAGIFMYGAVLTGMVESDVERDALVQLQDHLSDSMRPGLAFLLGFAPLMLGLLLSGIALFLSRAVPRWVGPLLGVAVIGIMALGDTSISTLSDVLLTVALATIGICLWRSTSGARAS